MTSPAGRNRLRRRGVTSSFSRTRGPRTWHAVGGWGSHVSRPSPATGLSAGRRLSLTLVPATLEQPSAGGLGDGGRQESLHRLARRGYCRARGRHRLRDPHRDALHSLEAVVHRRLPAVSARGRVRRRPPSGRRAAAPSARKGPSRRGHRHEFLDQPESSSSASATASPRLLRYPRSGRPRRTRWGLTGDCATMTGRARGG